MHRWNLKFAAVCSFELLGLNQLKMVTAGNCGLRGLVWYCKVTEDEREV